MSRRTLITSALPYANGSIHIGHLVEYIQTDIYVRFLKLIGEETHYFCASDCHGTPTEIKAASLGITPGELVSKYNEEHRKDFEDFQIEFDRFYKTDSPETEKHSIAIFEAAKKKDLIYTKDVKQMYCEHDRRFLPDRYIRGVCPKCKAPDQYGDSCEVCGTTYTPADLAEPRCAICGNPPVPRSSKHYFYALSKCEDFLKEWVHSPGRLQPAAAAWINNWIEEGLRDWDISRDAPYFGFKIPGEEDKYFYVWLDAPVGYIGTTEKWCSENGLNVDDFWKNPETRIIHFIGTDITYFHTLFWPVMLHNADYNVPDKVQIHGFLKVNGVKMSKSRGTFIMARTFLDYLDPQYLRYYYAAKLKNNLEDLDLNLDEFVDRVNAELINKIANLASRAIPFVNKNFESRLGKLPQDSSGLTEKILSLTEEVRADYDKIDFSSALRGICEISDLANKYFQDNAPWETIKSDPEKARDVCTFGVNCVRIIAILIKPVLPEYAAKIEKTLGLQPQSWSDIAFDLTGIGIGPFERLVERVDAKRVQAMVDASVVPEENATEQAKPAIEPIKPEITIEDFAKVDMRVGKIMTAEDVPEADKILKLAVDIGEEQPRTVFAGIKKHFDPQTLVGQTVIVVANLKPRKMKFGTSSGMVLATHSGEKLYLLSTDEQAQPGSTVS